jgi:O-antigen/teichoic acid export membrane protein
MQHIGKNIFSLALSRIVSGVILFFVYIRLVTYLGPSEWGKFSLVVAYYMIFSLLADLGIARFVIKKVSEDKGLASLYLGNFLAAQTLLSLAVLLVFVILPRFFGYDPEIKTAMGIAGLGLFLYSLSIPFSAIVQAWQKIHLVAAVNFVNALLHAAWIIAAILFQKQLIFVFGFYILIGIADVALYWFLTRKLALPSFQIQSRLVKQMLIFGIPFAFISGFEMLISKIDVVIQKFFLPFFQIGFYTAAYRFLDFLTFIPAVVAISLFPYISEQKDFQDREVTHNLNRLVRYSVVLGLPLGVGGTLLAKGIITTLFDINYLGAVQPFQILIWSTVLTILYAVPNVIILVKKTAAAVFTLGLATALNIIGNWLLVPKYGILASAWLTVISYLAVGVIYFLLARKIASFSFFRFFPWPVIASVVMGLLIWQARSLNVILGILLGAGVYLAILTMARVLGREDLNFLKAIFIRRMPE